MWTRSCKTFHIYIIGLCSGHLLTCSGLLKILMREMPLSVRDQAESRRLGNLGFPKPWQAWNPPSAWPISNSLVLSTSSLSVPSHPSGSSLGKMNKGQAWVLSIDFCFFTRLVGLCHQPFWALSPVERRCWTGVFGHGWTLLGGTWVLPPNSSCLE